MDKRYILICVIIFVCCANLYIIADFSDIVGSASVESGGYIFAIPQGFTLYESNSNHVLLHDSSSGMYIDIFQKIGKDNYSSKLEEFENDSNIKIYSKGVINKDNIQISSIYYKVLDENQNRSVYYFTKYNHDFKIMFLEFDYNKDSNKTMNYIIDIVDSIKIDYKK